MFTLIICFCLQARPIDGIYSSSKHALEALSDSLRREVSQFNISVSVIEPAFIKTKIFERSQSAGNDILVESREEMMGLYGKYYTEKKREAYDRQIEIAPGPSVTSQAILHSIISRHPQTRYPVSSGFGISASLMRWISKLCPDRLLDLFLEN